MPLASAQELSLRERKKRRTQRDLEAAALHLFAEHGFDHVTTDDIAAAAEVSKTTFYRYFASKEDVLLGNIDDHLAKVRAALNARPAEEPVLEAVRNAILSLADEYEQDHESTLERGHLMRATPSLRARNLEQQSAFERVLAEFVAERRGANADTDLASRLAGAHAIASMRVAIDYWLDTRGTDELVGLVDFALRMLADGPDAALRLPVQGDEPGTTRET